MRRKIGFFPIMITTFAVTVILTVPSHERAEFAKLYETARVYKVG